MELNIKINCHSSLCINDVYYFDPYNVKNGKHNARVVFITHPHYDHLDKLSIMEVSGEKTMFVCPLDAKSALCDIGIDQGRIVALLPNQEFDICGAKGVTLPAYNKTKMFHPKANNWLGYLFEIDGTRYLVCGDTDAIEPLESVKTDVMFVPIGGTYTMTAAEAAELVNKVMPKVAIPVHYGLIVGNMQDEALFFARLKKGISGLKLIK